MKPELKDGDNWEKWSVHIMFQLDALSNNYTQVLKDMNEMSKQIVALQTKMTFVSGGAGLAASLVINGLLKFIGG